MQSSLKDHIVSGTEELVTIVLNSYYVYRGSYYCFINSVHQNLHVLIQPFARAEVFKSFQQVFHNFGGFYVIKMQQNP